MIQINLLPDIKKEFIRAQKARNDIISICIFIIIGCVALLGLLFFYINAVQRGQDWLVSKSISDTHKDLKKVDELEKYLTVQSQLSALPSLHEQKSIYSRMFAYLPVLNPAPPNNVGIGKLYIDESNTSVTLTGSATNFPAVNVFKNSLENASLTYKQSAGQAGDSEEVKEKLFSEVLTSEVGISQADTGGRVVRFTITMTYNPMAFSNTVTDAAAQVPVLNATNSVQQSPGLFSGNVEEKPEE